MIIFNRENIKKSYKSNDNNILKYINGFAKIFYDVV